MTSDGDGVNNGDEYVASTSPIDNTDYLRMTQIMQLTNGIVVRFPAKPQREY